MAEPIYSSPLGLFEFQAEGVALGYCRESNLFAWDTGIGKSHLGMATAALLFEDDLIDLALVVCKANKLDEWVADFGTFTTLDVALYHGPKRKKMQAALPRVLVTTYETFKLDVARKETYRTPKGKLSSRVVVDEFGALLAKQRLLVIFDEMPAKLSSRRSTAYKHIAAWLDHARKTAPTSVPNNPRAMALTATPMDKDPEGFFNIGRLLTYMGTVAEFERDHVVYRTPYGAIGKSKNLSSDSCEPGVISLAEKMRPIWSRKSKTDPDVVDQFPHMIEEWSYVPLDPKHLEFYKAITEMTTIDDEGEEIEERAAFTVLRQIAGHPLSLTLSKGALARHIVADVGYEGLAQLGSAKLERVVADLETVIKGQGAQVVLFTFFGQSILPLVGDRLTAEGYKVALHHGGLSRTQRSEAQALFRSGGADIFLTSDAGSDGINLPEAEYVWNYESPLTHTNYLQRIGRIDRIDSKHHIIFARTYISLSTIEETIASLAHKRNGWHDRLVGDLEDGNDGLTAEERKQARTISRNLVTANLIVKGKVYR